MQRLTGNPRMRVGAGLIVLLVGLSASAPLVSPYHPNAQPDVVGQQYLPPSLAHPFGTDQFSRDLLSRVLHGARISLTIAILSVVLSATIGTGVGLVAGLMGGVIDTAIMRAVDAILAIPQVFLLLVVFALWGDVSIGGMIIVFAATTWLTTSRIVRAEVLSLKRREFFTAAHALGIGRRRLMLRHLLPNVAAPVLVVATLGVGHVVLMEAGLSYLGLGVPAPTATLGHIIQEGYEALSNAPWVSTFPALVIVMTVIGFSLLGDALRESLDPRAS